MGPRQPITPTRHPLALTATHPLLCSPTATVVSDNPEGSLLQRLPGFSRSGTGPTVRPAELHFRLAPGEELLSGGRRDWWAKHRPHIESTVLAIGGR